MKSRKSALTPAYNTDVVIIGSGGGLAAAVAAAEKGARVVVLEKRKVFGGNYSPGQSASCCREPCSEKIANRCAKRGPL